MDRLIFHIDVNSAFLSWEAARRVAEGQPDLRDIPAVIGGDPEKRTGVVLAKSIPAKKFGVKTGEPLAAALRKCPDLVVAQPDFRLYVKNSHAFLDICRSYAPVVEQASIDECFCDMTGTSYLYPDPAGAVGQRLRPHEGGRRPMLLHSRYDPGKRLQKQVTSASAFCTNGCDHGGL